MPTNPDVLLKVLDAIPDLNPQPRAATAGGGGVDVDVGDGIDVEAVLAKLSPKLLDLIAQAAGPDGDRSAHFYQVICLLREEGISLAEIYALAKNAPFAAKYAGRIEQEVDRAVGKWEAKEKARAEENERYKRMLEKAKKAGKVVQLKPTSQERPEEALDDADEAAEAELHEDDSAKDGLPKGYRYKRDWNGAPLNIEYYVEGTEKKEAHWVYLCSAVEFRAVTRNADGKGWGLALRIRTPDGAWNVMTISQAATAEPKLFFAALLDQGLVIPPYNKPTFINLVTFAAFSTKNRLRCVPQVGWHDQPDGRPVFALPDETYGAPGAEEVVYQPQWNERHSYRRNGTREGWQADVAKYAVGNSRIVFAIATAFAGTLLYPLGIEGGGFHFVGSSSIGKTTLLRAAIGIWGGGGVNGGIETWRATDNALEGTAAAHCDTFLPLDEMSQATADAVYHGAYMLSNGRGKLLMTPSAVMKQASEWRIMLLSTGEVTLADKIAERGARAMAGQEIRIVDIPADAGCGCGIFEELHDFDQPGKLADAIKANGSKNYGHAGRAFVNRFTDDIDGVKQRVKESMRAFEDSVCPINADGQVKRVCQRFALVAAAGELAAEWGILPWPKGEAVIAAEKCFQAWLEKRGGAGPQEMTQALGHVKLTLERDGSSRFQKWNCASDKVINRLGYVRDDPTDGRRFYILPEMFRRDVCKGLDAKLAALALKQAGALIHDRNRATKRVSSFRKQVFAGFLCDRREQAVQGR